MKIYFKEVGGYKHNRHEVCSWLGWVIGKLVLVGAGYIIG